MPKKAVLTDVNGKTRASESNLQKASPVLAISDNAVIVLGLLQESPAHPYDLNKTLEERGYRNWTSIGFSSIYQILKDLKKDNLVEVREEVKDSRPRKVYHITPRGHAALVAEVKRIVAHPARAMNEWDLGIAYMNPLLSYDEQIRCLEECRDQLLKDLAFLEGQAGGFPEEQVEQIRHTYNIRALFEHPAFIVRARLSFLEKLVRTIKRLQGI